MTIWDLDIRPTSDWHVGLGAGRPGLVDRLVRRDHRDLPYLPAKTILGILRDSATIAADALDSAGEPGADIGDSPSEGDDSISASASSTTWRQWVEVLFGSRPGLTELTSTNREGDPNGPAPGAPRPGALGADPALLPAGLAAELAASPALAAATTANRPGVKISRLNGSAQQDMFRQIEVTRAGLPLPTTLRLADSGWTEEQRATAAALLAVALRLADRLGGKRRRGLGQVTMTVPGLDVDTHRPRLDQPPAPPPASHLSPESASTPEPEPLGAASRPDPATSTGSGQLTSWELAIDLDTPVCVPERVVGNNVTSQRVIPGSVLLPAVANELRRRVAPNRVDRLIAEGQLIIGEATPDIDGERAEPIPFGLHAERCPGRAPRPAINTLARPAPVDQGPRKEVRQGFITTHDRVLRHDTVGLFESSHNVIAEETQRPTREVGGLYTYQAIPAGRRYRFVVTSEADEVLTSAVESLADVTLRVGVAKRADYGAVTVASVSPRTWAGGHDDTIVVRPGRDLTVRLLSPAVIHDEWLRPSSRLKDLARALEEALADAGSIVELELKPDDDKQGGQRHAAVRSFRRDSWLANAGLPKPSIHGLAAGSVAVFEVKEGTITVAAKTAVELTGIGERRSEGLGQVALGDPITTEPDLVIEQVGAAALRLRIRSSLASARDQSTDHEPLLVALARTALRRDITQAAIDLMYDDDYRRKNWGLTPGSRQPTQSQLGSLRQLISLVRLIDDQSTVRDWLDQLGNNDNRASKWPDQTIETLRDLVADDGIETVYEHLGLAAVERRRRYRPDENTDRDLALQLWPEAFRAVVIAAISGHRRANDRIPDEPDADAGGSRSTATLTEQEELS